MLQPINFAKRGLRYACAKKKTTPTTIAVVLRGGWTFSKIGKTCTSKASEANKASQTSQLIHKLCCRSLLLCKTLLTTANACILSLLVAVAGCCGWLLLVAVAGFCCYIFVIR